MYTTLEIPLICENLCFFKCMRKYIFIRTHRKAIIHTGQCLNASVGSIIVVVSGDNYSEMGKGNVNV